jgi:two-component system, chemotaxis family, chemotaxis protein CheY
MARVLIVDDAAFMRLSIKTILQKYDDLEVVGEAENGVMGVLMYKELKPDIVTMDITMPVMTGTEAVKEILSYEPKAKVLMLSTTGQEKLVKEAIMNGAKTFILKPFKEGHLVQTIRNLVSN